MTQTLVPVAKPFPLGGWAGTAAGTINWIGFGMLFASIPAAAHEAVARLHPATYVSSPVASRRRSRSWSAPRSPRCR